jgi:hypothetical protein
MAKLSTLFDDFEDGTLNTTLWDDSVNATEGSGYVTIPADGSYTNKLGTTTTYDLTEDSFQFELTFSAGATVGAEQFCQLFTGAPGQTIQMGRFQQSIGYDYNGASEFVTYNATDHRFCRIRTTATQIFFETSADGSSWSNPFTTGVQTLAAWSLTSLAVQFINGFFSGSGGGDMRIMQVGASAPTSPQTFTTSGTWTAPDNVTSVTVECWGGGGAGGKATGNPAEGGGGAGGAYAKKVVSVTPGNTYTVTVGAATGANTGTTVVNGNDSWFGTTGTVIAKGGAGGTAATTNSSNGTGGTGTTTGSIGDTVYAGGSGANGSFSSSLAGGAGGGGAGDAGAGGNASGNTGGTGGTGTTTSGGAGAGGVADGTAGTTGTAPGGGGSGGDANTATDRNGGGGARGLVILTWSEGSTTPSDSDTSGAATETQAIAVSDSDTGTGTESQSIAASSSDSDTGSGTEDQTIGTSDSDTSNGTETESISASGSDSDTGSGAEEIAVIAVSDSDTSSATEFQSAGQSTTDSDPASGTETESITAAVSQTETATGTESESISASGSDTDTGAGTESHAIGTSDNDTGSGTESEDLGFTPDSEGSSGTESEEISATLSSEDAGSGSETQTITAEISDTDTVTATEDQDVAEDLTTPQGSEEPGATEYWHIAKYHQPYDERNLVLGPATLYIAPYGAVEPANGAVASAPDSGVWTDLGGILGGVELTIQQDWFEVELKQLPDKPMKRLKKRRLSIKTQLAEPTLANLAYALNDTLGATGEVFEPSNRSEASVLSYNALIVDGWAPGHNPGGQHKRRRLIIRKCLSVDNVEMAYTKEGQSVYTVTWTCHYVDSTTPIFRVVDEA